MSHRGSEFKLAALCFFRTMALSKIHLRAKIGLKCKKAALGTFCPRLTRIVTRKHLLPIQCRGKG
jgi:hypothetical protein